MLTTNTYNKTVNKEKIHNLKIIDNFFFFFCGGGWRDLVKIIDLECIFILFLLVSMSVIR